MKRIVLTALLSFGMGADSLFADAKYELFEEIRKANLKRAEAILAEDPYLLEQPDNRGRSAVFYAIESGKPEALQFVLERRTGIDEADNSGDYPIHAAAKIPDSKIMELLLTKDSNLDYLNRNGENALDLATDYGNVQVAAFLLARGIKPAKGKSGPFTIALYVSFLVISILMTVWVARTLSKNGRVFLVQMFSGEEKLADSINHLLIVGFYLINIGYISLSLTSNRKPLDLAECIETLTTKVGIVLLILGAMHFFNLYLFAKFRKRISNTFGETHAEAGV
ncbi:ankyrin repeat domain-containing protein [Leptospira gomenensis]|uniref:Ankyrin repeat domain-containing protein n=1 Tax=Leptospira gomenensis TaxID=2484974 RepID=A0A5F1YB02_9LEPT|nr:ankyrin repeat domain-containing protein [Leptospira gomenensis]TGK33292.1 ankyrin repeat domain-containing protein [Leptospira gomenensis]TGK45115.1 ankyrin repeat domain-containing protein [Leptospira gomenensis]TGK50900.1 ankyrin repeat domain-containing protein [Leptospira gomenensis]TGK56523.1 ankyrin repeat domain-containing protein [Leptospira gomenensis]